MKESAERTVKVGFRRKPRKVFDEVEALSAQMKRDGWVLSHSIIEEALGKIHLFFEREINTIKDWPEADTNPQKGQLYEI